MIFIEWLNGLLVQVQKDMKVSKLDAIVYKPESSFKYTMRDDGFLKIKHDLYRGLSDQAVSIILSSHEYL